MTMVSLKARLSQIWRLVVRAPRVRELSQDVDRRANEVAVTRKEIEAMVKHARRRRS
jgi:hypothetical protein